MAVQTHSHVSPPSFGNATFDNGVCHGISWQSTGDIAYRQATAQLIVDFIKDNILEPESDMPVDEERLTDHLGFLTGWIIGQFL
jgi:hypothetical protein